MPAAKEWRHKTTRPDESWQRDGTNLFIVGWGYYKLISVEDDYARKILGQDLRPEMAASVYERRFWRLKQRFVWSSKPYRNKRNPFYDSILERSL